MKTNLLISILPLLLSACIFGAPEADAGDSINYSLTLAIELSDPKGGIWVPEEYQVKGQLTTGANDLTGLFISTNDNRGFISAPLEREVSAYEIIQWEYTVLLQQSSLEYQVFALDSSGQSTMTQSRLLYAGDMETEDNDSNSLADSLSQGKPLFAELEVDDSDWYHMGTLYAGTQYTFRTLNNPEGTAADTMLFLHRDGDFDDGQELTNDDDSGSGHFSKIIYTPSVSTNYYLRVSHYDSNSTGFYAVSFE